MKKQVIYDIHFKDAKEITESFIVIDTKLQSVLNIWVNNDINFKDAKEITESFIVIDTKLQSVLNIWINILEKILRQNDSKDPTKKQKKGC